VGVQLSRLNGIGSSIGLWTKFADGSPEDRKNLVKDVNFWRLYQAVFIGFQYFCFNCMSSCAGDEMSMNYRLEFSND